MKLLHRPVTKVILIAIGILILLYISLPGQIMFNFPPHIKNLLWIIFIISGFLLLITYIKPKNHPGPPLRQRNALPKTLNEISGTMLQYGNNPMGDIDKILLQQGNQRIWLHFPPHTAQQVMNVAVKPTTINATVHHGKMPPHDSIMRYELISLSSDALGKTINVHDIAPPAPVRGKWRLKEAALN